jgi:hypothetical protein
MIKNNEVRVEKLRIIRSPTGILIIFNFYLGGHCCRIIRKRERS